MEQTQWTQLTQAIFFRCVQCMLRPLLCVYLGSNLVGWRRIGRRRLWLYEAADGEFLFTALVWRRAEFESVEDERNVLRVRLAEDRLQVCQQEATVGRRSRREAVVRQQATDDVCTQPLRADDDHLLVIPRHTHHLHTEWPHVRPYP